MILALQHHQLLPVFSGTRFRHRTSPVGDVERPAGGAAGRHNSPPEPQGAARHLIQAQLAARRTTDVG